MIALETDAGPILAPFWAPKSDARKSIEKVIEKLVSVEKPVAAIYRGDDGNCVVRLWISDVARLHRLELQVLCWEPETWV